MPFSIDFHSSTIFTASKYSGIGTNTFAGLLMLLREMGESPPPSQINPMELKFCTSTFCPADSKTDFTNSASAISVERNTSAQSCYTLIFLCAEQKYRPRTTAPHSSQHSLRQIIQTPAPGSRGCKSQNTLPASANNTPQCGQKSLSSVISFLQYGQFIYFGMFDITINDLRFSIDDS